MARISALLASTIFAAGEVFDITLSFTDSWNQPVDLLDSGFDLSRLTIRIIWKGDSGTTASLGSAQFDQRKFKVVYPLRIYSELGGVVKARIALEFQGTYDLYYEYASSAHVAEGLTNSISVIGRREQLSAKYSFVKSPATFPPASMISGETYSFDFQVCDVYMNPIYHSSVLGYALVSISITGSPDGSCTETSNGIFTCTISPIVAGKDMTLSISLDFSPVGTGPWNVDVLPGPLDLTKSVVSEVQATYIIGRTYSVSIPFTDSNDNPTIADQSIIQSVSLTFSDSSNSYPQVATFWVDSNGILIISFVVSASNQNTLVDMIVIVNGVTIPLDAAYVNAITLVMGKPEETTSVCEMTSTTPLVVTSPISFTCTLKDISQNQISGTDYLVQIALKNTIDWSVPYTKTLASSSPGIFSESISVHVPGTYEFMGTFSKPYGLTAEYYASDVVGLNIRNPFIGKTSLVNSRIDESIDMDWQSGMSVDGLMVNAARWHGYINLEGSTILNLYGNGEVKLFLDGNIALDQLGDTANPSGTFSATLSLPQNTFTEIEIFYVPSGTLPRISLTYTTSLPQPGTFVVPPEYLYSQVQVGGTIPDPPRITVTSGDLDPGASTISFPFQPILGQDIPFYLYLRDTYGNAISSNSCDHVYLTVVDLYAVSVYDATVLCAALTGPYTGDYYIGSLPSASPPTPIDGASINAFLVKSGEITTHAINTNHIVTPLTR
jgi:hypothetical protein